MFLKDINLVTLEFIACNPDFQQAKVLASITFYCPFYCFAKKGNKDELEHCVIQRQFGESVVLWMLTHNFSKGKYLTEIVVVV